MGEAPARHRRAAAARSPAPTASSGSARSTTTAACARSRRRARTSSSSAAASSAPRSRPRSSATACSVTMVFPEPGIGFRLFPLGLVGVRRGVLPREGRRRAHRRDRRTRPPATGVDARRRAARSRPTRVVAGLGVIPDTELAEAAGLEVDDGIVVDEYGRVSGHDDVFAAGDVARFPVRALGTSMRVEHEDHANTHGKAVGANMAGAGAAVRPPAVLLLRPLRPRLRGRRAGRLPARGRRGLAGAEPQGRRHVRRGRQAARRAALERLGQGRRRPRPDPRRRGSPCASSAARPLAQAAARRRSSCARRSSGRSRTRSSSFSRACACRRPPWSSPRAPPGFAAAVELGPRLARSPPRSSSSSRRCSTTQTASSRGSPAGRAPSGATSTPRSTCS